MELSPEERKRIYEEEKERIEAEEKFKAARVGRIASSSITIAWSIVFLILFNFFSKYLAYYRYESGQWARYPILTADFGAWLPIITVTLILSLVGHIIAIIFDKYLLRETTLIVLNLLGMAATISLLSIFPFDFSAIPDTAAVDILPVVVAIALIGIAFGLGVAALVRLIKLIVSEVTRTAQY